MYDIYIYIYGYNNTKIKNKNNNFDVVITDKNDNTKQTISFGQAGAKDYRSHDAKIRDDRKKAYIARHKKNGEPSLNKSIYNLHDKLDGVRSKIVSEIGGSIYDMILKKLYSEFWELGNFKRILDNL